MKKVFSMLLLFAVSGALASANLHAGGAFDQLMDTSRDSEAATREPSDEGAREGASQGFDTGSSTPVDLSGKEGVVDPNDLKRYDPPAQSLHTNPPPPLP
ncbi:hypothetical protein BIU88_07200 [Chlorobaculum limnaeum]|uniref:Uncharacterized protein n=1 Tax=Chlorobaculum limnaeum TaxID=274537 RepID=A0A1D8D1F0_CHLLM|nr:hypothetical protein [Chlorobaculum limnaeum]AOS83953.1 hypothetical protein BIU88_07200 [Chlorobaculum limnaeum]